LKVINLIGQKFGRLIVIKQARKDKNGHIHWLCKCSCNKIKIVRGNSLKCGQTQSCGCLQKERTATTHNKHNCSQRGQKFRTYRTWKTMIQRCTNHNDTNYDNYGNRGITVCKRWMNFLNFLKDMGERPIEHSIDRRNNYEGYCKENCYWATLEQQARNKRNNHLETYNDETQCIIIWAEKTGINKRTILWRLKNSWSIEKTLTTPVRKRRKHNET
jgi:hypothetical protein